MSIVLFALCTVIAVSDGDSLTAQCQKHKTPIVVRLAEIDAPELSHPAFHIALQPYGPEAEASLTILCLKQPATVRRIGFDKYQRAIAQVTCNGVNANEAQVKAGMAWAYTANLLKNSHMPALQAQAQAAGLGLWAEPNPTPPWVWRKQ